MDFKVNNIEVGTHNSELDLTKPGIVHLSAKIAAYLNEVPDDHLRKLKLDNTIWQQKPFWSIERSRIGNTRMVPVELIVNGIAVATKNLIADGSINDISFDTPVTKSSWVAIRILYSSHSNPVFVIVDNKPIRASAKSAEWCLKAVDQCWSQKSPKFSAADKKDAEKFYEKVRLIYKTILDGSK